MEESVLLGTKPLVDSIRHFIRDPSGVFSVCHLCSCHSNIKFISTRHRVISSIYFPFNILTCPMYSSNESHGNVSLTFIHVGFTKRTEERANHGPDVDWYSCADRRGDWWPVYVVQLVRLAKGLRRDRNLDTHFYHQIHSLSQCIIIPLFSWLFVSYYIPMHLVISCFHC